MTTTIRFRDREFKGSRLRCLLLTSSSREKFSSFLQELIVPHAEVEPKVAWLPCGFLKPQEVCLDKRQIHDFLSDDQREQLATWWLKNRRRATTPTWDIVATCKIEGKRGLVLVEAKAHCSELATSDQCKSSNADNCDRIKDAMRRATEGLTCVIPGWSLRPDSHYQISNRFALAWKIASMGVPVIVVYLGFLNVWDMDEGIRKVLPSSAQWRACVLNYSKNTIPRSPWEARLDVGGTPLIPLIRAAHVEVLAQVSCAT